MQENYATAAQIDTSYNNLNTLLSNAKNLSQANSSGYTFSNNLLLQHKLHKKGRTISLNIGTTLNEKSGDGYNKTNTGFRDTTAYGLSRLNQNYNLYNNSNTLSANLSYTEPLGKKTQLMINYNPSVTKSTSDKETDSIGNGDNQAYRAEVLSNKYASTYTTQRGGITYRIGDKLMNLNFGTSIQSSVLDGDQTYPSSFNISKTYTNVLPNLFFNYRYKDGRNLRIMYRTSISPPGITQLQNVVDRSNPLLLSTGNSTLKQDYEHTFTLRYSLTQSKTAHNFFIYGYANYITNYIGNATYTNDSLVPSSLNIVDAHIKSGGQLSVPVNMNYYSSEKLFITYGLPLSFIKSNLNLNGGLNYTHTPGQVNKISEFSNNYVPTAGAVVSSNISEKLDFTLSYTGNYNFVNNSLQSQANNNYYNHVASFKINWIFLKGVVLNTSIAHNYYSTFSSSAGNLDFLLWNAYVGYKFMKNKALEARISAFDILNQNKSLTRTVAANYVENDLTRVLQQYFLFQLTYTLRNFKGPLPDQEGNQRDHERGMPGIPGMPPGGGGPGGGWRDRNGG